ncbi:MAG: glutathione S-transferase family protein [Oceanospirillaceae bacterium]
MYTLYYVNGACSLATQTVLHELGEPVEIIEKSQAKNFVEINPVGTVPVLIDGEKNLTEGAAVMIYLLNKHNSSMLPKSGDARTQAIQHIMFANATMHPAYGRLFFIAQNISDQNARTEAFKAAADSISALWKVVEDQLQDKPYLGGNHPSGADILLSVYSRWGEFFPIDIEVGDKVKEMTQAVINRPSFQRALAEEQAQVAA